MSAMSRKEYNKKCYQKNKEHILKRVSKWEKERKCYCCGKEIKNKNYSKPLLTKEHHNWIKSRFQSIHNELLEKFRT